MITPLESKTQNQGGLPTMACTITRPWPTYGNFRTLPQCERWLLYGSAKAYRESLGSPQEQCKCRRIYPIYPKWLYSAEDRASSNS